MGRKEKERKGKEKTWRFIHLMTFPLFFFFFFFLCSLFSPHAGCARDEYRYQTRNVSLIVFFLKKKPLIWRLLDWPVRVCFFLDIVLAR